MTDDFAEYAVLIPLSELPMGDAVDRSHWPRHVTVLPNFRWPRAHQNELENVIDRIASITSPPRATIARSAMFGPAASVAVQLVDSTGLHTLHENLAGELSAVGSPEPLEPSHWGLSYRPHVTITADGPLLFGEPLELSRLVLVEIGPAGDLTLAVPVAAAQFAGSQGR